VANRIKPVHRKAIEEYVEKVRVALGLLEWRIVLLDEPTEDDEAVEPPTAQISTTETHHLALMRVGDRFFDDDGNPDNLRTETLIHEVLHLHFEFAWHAFLEVAHSNLAGQALGLAKYSYRTNIERGVDQLAHALASMLPPFKLPK